MLMTQQLAGQMGGQMGGQPQQPPMRNPEQLMGTQGADGLPDEPGYSGQQELEAIQRAATAAPSMEGTVNNV